jgi:hypothetical protein
MNVEPNAAPRRDREDTVELPLRVAVNLQRIDAADQIGAVANRRIKQVEDARATHHTALRERNDLHRHPIAIALACRKHPFQLRDAAFEIDVDVGAQMAGAARDAHADQIAGAFFGRAPLIARRGRRIVNSLNSPTRLSTSITPPCCWVTMSQAIGQTEPGPSARRLGRYKGLE